MRQKRGEGEKEKKWQATKKILMARMYDYVEFYGDNCHKNFSIRFGRVKREKK
jgi:hypothetical protein